jgi:hypothetical protein
MPRKNNKMRDINIEKLIVPRWKGMSSGNPIAEVNVKLNESGRAALAYSPWGSYINAPIVQFTIAYGSDCIFLKFFVEEKTIRAVNNSINASVWEDSCVEFFVAFDDGGYYNLEFNCIGTACAGYGKSKTNRFQLQPGHIKTIRYQSIIEGNRDGGNVKWELALSIPLEIFVYTNVADLHGKECAANFYKCGDLLPEPHFITWNNIIWAEPNFHLPAFFGTLYFQ